MAEQRRRLRGKLIVAAIAIFVAGFGIGLYFGSQWLPKTMAWMNAIGTTTVLSEHAYMQYREGTYDEAKTALEHLLSYLEAAEPEADPFLDGSTRAADKGFTYGRLALLEERQKRTDAATIFWAKAEEQMRQTATKDPSHENLRHVLERLDGGIWPRPVGPGERAP